MKGNLPKGIGIGVAIGIIVVLVIIFIGIMVTPDLHKGIAPAGRFDLYSGDQKSNSTASTPGIPVSLKKEPAKIIKTASIRFQVKELGRSSAAIRGLVQKYNGYLASENQRNSNNEIENTLVIRVPAEQFDPLIQSLRAEAIYMDYKNIEAKDVTEEYVDTETRLKAKREVEQRYLAILRQAKTVTDILEVESRLGTIREEIEATEGKFRYLNDQIAYSTITLIIYQPVHQSVRPGIGFWSELGKQFVDGWRGFLAVVTFLVRIWPLVIILAAGIWLYGRRKKRDLSKTAVNG